MSEYTYSVIRYIADPIRNEPVNIGLIMHSAEEHCVIFRFALQRRPRRKIPKPDMKTLSHYQEQLRAIENGQARWEEASFETTPVADPLFLEKVADYIGNKIRFDTPRGCRTDDAARTFEELFERFVAARTSVAMRV
jgi:hypothetical protein